MGRRKASSRAMSHRSTWMKSPSAHGTYNNGAGPQHADGFGRIDIAELLIYNRTLAAAELESLRKYLDARYSFIKDVLPR